jgi:flagellar hook-length control protein FliK
LLSEASLVSLGNPKDAGLHGKTTAPLLPAVASGKNRDGGGGTPIKAHRPSDETPVPGGQADLSQPAPVSAPTTVAVALQPPVGIVDMRTIELPRLSDKVVASTPQTKVGGGDKPADPHRPAPADPGEAQPAAADHPAGAASPPAVLPTVAESEKIVDRSAALPETPALVMRAEVPQTSSSGPAPSALSQTGQAQSAAPVDQIAPVLVASLQKSDGQQSVTVRLQPAELGQVQIRVDQSVAGAAHIAITADRPETLQLLQRDEPGLQQVLDQAGVASTGRTVSFQVSAQEQIGATASRPDSMQTGAGGSGQGQNGGAWRQNGDSPNDFGRSPDPDQGRNRPRWFRAGLDITA